MSKRTPRQAGPATAVSLAPVFSAPSVDPAQRPGPEPTCEQAAPTVPTQRQTSEADSAKVCDGRRGAPAHRLPLAEPARTAGRRRSARHRADEPHAGGAAAPESRPVDVDNTRTWWPGEGSADSLPLLVELCATYPELSIAVVAEALDRACLAIWRLGEFRQDVIGGVASLARDDLSLTLGRLNAATERLGLPTPMPRPAGTRAEMSLPPPRSPRGAADPSTLPVADTRPGLPRSGLIS